MQKETIQINSQTFAELEKIVAQSEAFASVDEYVNFVLETLLFGDSEIAGEDEQQLQRRLQDLGYL